ncbi:MAG: YwaF family protein [Lachnospiraceae bacterium]|nr:YwaF family protein [Lachnospiraceae bacterium]
MLLFGSWIITPFNGVFFASFGFFIALLVVASLLLRGKSERTKVIVLISACAVTLVGFVFYKYFLSLDTAYSEITADMGGFNWWGELPLQLCNINMILIPIAVLTKNRPMMCFCFFLGPLGAMMALFMPGNGFDGYSLLLPRMIGYYGTHYMVVIEGFAIVTFGLFRPKLRDLAKAVLTALVIAFVIFCINMLLRVTGLHEKANYFFAVETEGNALLELFHKMLPFPFLYLIPCTLILVPYMLLITVPLEIADRRKAKAGAAEQGEEPKAKAADQGEEAKAEAQE